MDIDELVIRITSDITGAIDGIRKVQDEVKGAASRIEDVGSKFKAAGGAMKSAGMDMVAATAPIATGLGLAVKSAADFEGQMNTLKVVGQGTAAQMNAAREQILQLSTAYGESTDSITKTATDFAAVGFKMADAIDLTEQASMLAKAGLGSQEQATILLTQAISQYNLTAQDAGRLTDVFSYIANATSANVAGLSTSFGYVGTTANAVGISINETAAVLGLIQNQLQDASMSGTGFREILNSFLDPSAEAKTLMEQYNIVIRDASGALLPMGTIVDNVKNAMGGLNAAERDQAMSIMFGVRGMSAMNALMTAGSAQIKELTEATKQSGYAQQTAAEMMKSPSAQFAQLQAEINATAIQIGNELLPALMELFQAIKDELPTIKELAKAFIEGLVPALKTILGVGKSIMDWFNSLNPEVKNAIMYIGGLAAAFMMVAGPLLIFGGMIASAIGSILGLAGAVSGAVPLITAALTFLTGPIGLVLLAITALAAAWQFNLFGIRDHVANAVASISEKWDTLTSFLSEHKDQIVNILTLLLGPIGAVILAFQNWDTIKETVSNISAWLTNTLTGLATKAWDWGKNLITSFVDGIKSMLNSVANVGADVADTIAGYIGIHSPAEKGPLSRLTEWGPNLVRTYAEGITRNMNLLDAAFMRMGSPQFGAAGTGIGAGRSVSLVMNPTYNITGASNTTDLRAALEQHDKYLLREIERRVM